jgi:hypothetical protein
MDDGDSRELCMNCDQDAERRSLFFTFGAQEDLEQANLERRSRMFPLSHNQFVSLAAAGAFVTLAAFNLPARADELVQLLGPVGPHQPIMASVGNKRVIAFYLPGGNTCAVHAVIGDNDINADTPAVRIRVSLEPGQIVHIDTTENKSLNLQCGSNAENLSIVDSEEAVAFGMPVQPDDLPVKASASGF